MLLDGLRRLRRDGLPAVVGGPGATWITLLTTAAWDVWGRRLADGRKRAASRRDPPMLREDERGREQVEHHHLQLKHCQVSAFREL